MSILSFEKDTAGQEEKNLLTDRCNLSLSIFLSLSAQLVNHAAVKFGRTMNASPMKTRYIVKIDLLILETACCTDLTISNKHIASKVSFVVHEDN